MRALILLLLPALAVGAANAQGPYPTTAGPPPALEGFTLPAPVPQQPPASDVWQPYPAADGIVTDGAVLGAAPGFPMQEPLFPVMSEPSLRESLTPPDARDGFFQKAKFTTTWMPQIEDDSLGWTDLRAEVMTALPFFTRENPILITPSYELHFVESPAGIDLPPRLHDAAIDFHVFRVYGNRWIADAAVTPGLYADDYSFDSDDALRVNGRVVGIYAPTLDVKWVLGMTYVNGAWAKIVPIVGVVYEPAEDVKYELVFPRPRVAWRLPSSPVPGRDEYWAYVLGEFGNAIWAFQQQDGSPDVLASRDWRIMLGLEHKVIEGLSSRVELGYVFNRDIKLASAGDNDISLDDTFLLRAGISY
jgi:hypothetical protein